MSGTLQHPFPPAGPWLEDFDTKTPAGLTRVATTLVVSVSHVECTFAASPLVDEMRRVAKEVGLPLVFPHGFPCLRTRDGQDVPLYQIVEEVEGQVDLGAVADELPRVTYGQLSATMEFVKRLLQLNERQLDIDELEDEFLLQRGLAQELRTAVS